MNEGRIVTTSGLSIEVSDYENHFEERQVPHSTALHSVRKQDGSCYCVGPMARVNLNFDRLSARARQLADDIGFAVPCFNPFKMIIARGLELVHAYDEALEILRAYRPFSPREAN